MKDQSVLVETRSLHHHAGPTVVQQSKSSLAALGSHSQGRAERLPSATATGTCHVPARYTSHASQRHKRSFASHYYTSSYPSLHALFCGDALLRNGDVIVKRSSQVSKSLGMNRPRAFTEPSLDAVQSIRFPWRHCGRVIPTGEKQTTKGASQTAQSESQASAGDGTQKDGGDKADRLGREFAEPRNGARAKGGTTDSERSKTERISSNSNNGEPQPTSRPPSGGRRIRSKSCVSRNPSSTIVTLKQRHRSTNSFASAPPIAPPPIRSSTAGPLEPRTTGISGWALPKPTRSDRQYKVAFAQSYSAHFPPEERGRMIKTAQRQRTPRENEHAAPAEDSLHSDGESEAEDAATPDYNDPDKMAAAARKKKPPRNVRTAPVSLQQRSLTRRSTVACDSTRHRPLTDGRIGAAILYKEHLRPPPRKTFLSPDQLVVRESVEKVQRWIRTLPRHFDTIQHVLPPVRQDY